MKAKLQIELVTRWLKDSPSTRDDDALLCATIWWFEAQYQNMVELSINQFLFEYSRGTFTPAETITRSRRKVQEMHPELRGNKYKARKEASKTFKP